MACIVVAYIIKRKDLKDIEQIQKTMKPSLSIVVPALNEEHNLEPAIKSIKCALRGNIDDYEILVFDDGSTDLTGKIADKIARSDPNIKVSHNQKNMGIGYCYRGGVKLANKEHICFIPGDNENTRESLRKLFSLIKSKRKDIILTYIGNKGFRPLHRRIISESFVTFMNLLFNLRLRHYLSGAVYKTALVKKIKITTNSIAYQAEIIVQLIKAGHDYIEVGMNVQNRAGKSKIFKIKNLAGIAKTVCALFFEIYFHGGKQRQLKLSNF